MKTLNFLAALFLSATITAQTYTGKAPTALNLAQVAAGEYLYWGYDHDSVYVYNLDLQKQPSIAIPAMANHKPIVAHFSKKLFDQDAGIEFLITYDSAFVKTADVVVHDDGANTSLPNLDITERSNFTQVRNTPTGADLLVFTSKVVAGVNVQHTTVYGLVGKSLRVKELSLDLADAQVFPNPTADIIKVPGVVGEQVLIFDINGRIVLNKQLTQSEQAITVSQLESGTYLIKTSYGSTWKFVKQ